MGFTGCVFYRLGYGKCRAVTVVQTSMGLLGVCFIGQGVESV